jgi:hypothetical protein
MINYVYTDEEDNVVGVTTGCGCCSSNIYLKDNKQEFIDELKLNLQVLDKACAVLGITINELREL